ncbi:MAG: polysaccharide biosynthesis C-terminal domain-containing protein [Dehalococcoidia bacterium]
MRSQLSGDGGPRLRRLGGLGLRLAAGMRSPLYTNALLLWTSTAVASVGGFAFWALIARLYDAEEVGLGAAAVSALMLVGALSTLGLGMGLIRFLPGAGERGPALVNGALAAGAVAAVLAAAVFLAGIPLWAPDLGFLRASPLYVLAFTGFAVATTIATAQPYAFMAARKAGYMLALVLSVQGARFALAAALVALGAFGITATAGLASALAVAFGFVLLARGLPGYRPSLRFDPGEVQRMLPFSIANHVADVLILAPGLVLTIMVVRELGSEQAAYFYMAWFLGYLLASTSAHLSLSLFAVGSYRPEALRELSRSAVAAGLAIAGAGAIVVLLLGGRLLHAFGGDYAAAGAPLLRIMALAALPAAVVNVYLGGLRVAGRSKELVAIAAAVAVTTLALGYALLPSAGLEGPGVAFAAAQAVGLAMILASLLRRGEGTLGQRARWVLSLAQRGATAG